MENREVAALLAHDIEANITALLLGGVAVTLTLALIGVILSMRAYAILSEACALFWQASALSHADEAKSGTRGARAAAIIAAQSKRKLKSNRLRGVM